MRLRGAALVLLVLPGLGFSQNKISDALVERVDTTAFIQLEVQSFKDLNPKQKQVAYWLQQASIAVDPIIYDQLSKYGLREKRLLEEIVAHPQGTPLEPMDKIRAFAKLFWANRGNHNETTSQKIMPTFTFEELSAAAGKALKNGAMRSGYAGLPPIRTQAELDKELNELKAALFDPQFEPMITAKSPQGGKDILQASANTFYSDVALQDTKDFQEQYPLNSRLAKIDGKLVEQVYRAGTPDGKIKPGVYGLFLKKANEYLEKAAAAADPQQAKVIRDLIRYYQTGDPKDWITFGIDWVQNNEMVDFANGFIEVYRDARGAKGSSQSFVSVTDQRVNSLMQKLADNAQYFEDHAPWDPQYRKQGVKPPVAKAVETVIETGDFHVNTVGDNLPNENEIHEKVGSKSFLFTGSSRALYHAGGFAVLEEFAATPEEIEIGKKYGEEASTLMTALHEVIGHGSGKVSPKLTHEPAYYLKEYYSTLEEGRADLMALWNCFDPRMQEMGLISSPDVAKAMYYNAMRTVLVQLRSYPKGETIEEDHQRDRQMIVNYIMDKTGAIERIERNGKYYLLLKDFDKMREGVGMLLKELMRIKAEGDYEGIKALVDKYGTHFDPAVRDQVIARYKSLDLPTYWAGINADLEQKSGGVTISYPRNAIKQYLHYGAMYDPGLVSHPSTAAPYPRADNDRQLNKQASH
ncbi:MAG: peptidase M49 [Candidatus Angelobacter sp. Gp1-AA117]|nr:MAG: peptidase M49 [Candidatus Angelobacter sp. Gp1-AA117]